MKRELFVFFVLVVCESESSMEDRVVVMGLVEMWSEKIGKILNDISTVMTRESEFKKNFSALNNKLRPENPEYLVDEIRTKIVTMMDSKARAVRNISEYAEYLSYYRPDDNITEETPYYFFNADNITIDEQDPLRLKEIKDDILTAECHWFNKQLKQNNLSSNMFSDDAYRLSIFQPRLDEVGTSWDDCSSLPNNTAKSYEHLPLEFDERFNEKINLNLSVAKIATNVYRREQEVLEGVRWSEPLDLVFKINFINDPTLTWQYFASPDGFMRHYPAVTWSQEPYDRTYDFRTRPWYTEAITSPKDIIILLDRSGSMTGVRRMMSTQIVNQILDTLNDNDFVNIYTFTNTTEPLVDCFNDTLFQANEENLRLLREALTAYDEIYAADVSLGVAKAFQILETFRNNGASARCNQAIMIITEGIDYDYHKEIFVANNSRKNFPVRVFTYQIGQDFRDATELEEIACDNMGYWANMTKMGDIKEKMLKYLTVMSRPINLKPKTKRPETWTYLHVDLADRRLSNWLWKKFEGIRQRQVMLDHIKRMMQRGTSFFTSEGHMLLQKDKNDQYVNKWKYNYMTTVSLPVFGRRADEVELIGVAGIDVPIKLFKACVPFHRLGVNGYVFIVTNNGYILMHPDHVPEFEGILKPTFNRVDILEVEILDDNNEPRLFGKRAQKLREQLVSQTSQSPVVLRVKYPLDDLKRVMISVKHYYNSPIAPFTLGMVLPDKYGFVKVNESKLETPSRIDTSGLWGVHPEWIYCIECKGQTPKEKIIDAARTIKNGEKNPLLKKLFYDMDKTSGFDREMSMEGFQEYQIHKVFISTHSGLTRWKYLSAIEEDEVDSFERGNNKSIDEDWYLRTVEINYHNSQIFIYQVPFETSGYENNTMITSTKAIFAERNSTFKTPVAVVGVQFNHKTMNNVYNNITTQAVEMVQLRQYIKKLKIGINIEATKTNITCKIDRLNCYILDNNAYVVLSDEPEYIGRYLGDIRANAMALLIADGVYIPTRMFDYQAICQKDAPEPKTPMERYQEKMARVNSKNSGSRFGMIFHNIFVILKWIISTIIVFFNVMVSAQKYVSTKEDTIAFNKLEIPKTLPTPCDHEMWLFNLNPNIKYPFSPFTPVNNSKFFCEWHYVVNKIENSNLIFLATNDLGACNDGSGNVYSTEPKEIIYNISVNTNNSLPCYIAVNNNFTRRMYLDCDNRTSLEDDLYKYNHTYCGHNWE